MPKAIPQELRRLWQLIKFHNGLSPVAPLHFQQRGGATYYTMDRRPIHIRVVVDPTASDQERDAPDKNIVYVAVHGGGKGDTHSPSCFFLLVNRVTKNAVLEATSRRTDCFQDDLGIDSLLVVRAAYRWAMLHGIRNLEFTDNTHIHCPMSVELANLSMLTTGQIWYEAAVGGCYLVTPSEQVRLERDRIRVRRNTWDAVAGESPVLWEAFDSSGIDTAAEGSAMEVLQRAKMSRLACGAFHDHMVELIERSGIMSYFGKHWRWVLPAAEMRRQSRRRLRSGRVRRISHRRDAPYRFRRIELDPGQKSPAL